MAGKTKQTLIESGTDFDGSISSKCPIVLCGNVKGELTAPSLIVKSTGTVDGQVMVSELTSEGEISGEIDADVVELSGKVSDRTVIRAATLEVKLKQANGALQVTFGDCELHVGEDAESTTPRVMVDSSVEPEPVAT